MFDAFGAAQRLIAKYLGLTHQKAGLEPQREWVNFDMTDLDLMRALGVDGAPDKVPDFGELFSLTPVTGSRLMQRSTSRCACQW